MKPKWKEELTILSTFLWIALVIGGYMGIKFAGQVWDGYQKYQSHRETIDQIDRVKKEIRQYRPKASEKDITDEAILITAGSQEFNVPLKFQMACIKIETEFNPGCIGPCGERGLLQIYYPTFIGYYPPSKWKDPLYTYMAGMAFYEGCVRDARQQLKNKSEKQQIRLALLNHNTGAWGDKMLALSIGWKHNKRAQQLGIGEAI